jgi:hypothetical protein
LKTSLPFLKTSNAGSSSALHYALFCLVLLVLTGSCASVKKVISSSRVTPSVVSQPCSVTVHEFLFPSSLLNPGAITPGPDGMLWVLEDDPATTQGNPKDSFLGRLTPQGF